VNDATKRPVLGVIGGMGPEATLDLLRRILARTPAEDDADHLHVIVESNPKIPSRIAHLIDGTGADPTPELVRIARNLESAGATLLAMPCNTAHGYADSIRRAVNIPLLDMVQLATDCVRATGTGPRVGLLASTAVLRTQLYARAFAPFGMQTLEPADQPGLMDLIRGVKRGDTGSAARASLSSIASELGSRCDCLLIACTELSVLADAIDATVPVIDALDALTDAIVAGTGPA
jgi:aspartate racemase